MGVLRMIKLFGWERRAAQDIAEKREFEVDLVWRARMLDMTNFFVKCVHNHNACLHDSDS